MHVCINETHSLGNLQDLIPTLAGIIISSTIQGLNLIDLLECVSFMHTCVDVPTCPTVDNWVGQTGRICILNGTHIRILTSP